MARIQLFEEQCSVSFSKFLNSIFDVYDLNDSFLTFAATQANSHDW